MFAGNRSIKGRYRCVTGTENNTVILVLQGSNSNISLIRVRRSITGAGCQFVLMRLFGLIRVLDVCICTWIRVCNMWINACSLTTKVISICKSISSILYHVGVTFKFLCQVNDTFQFITRSATDKQIYMFELFTCVTRNVRLGNWILFTYAACSISD